MSIPRQMTVKCSKCGHTISTTVFESINTDYAEDIAAQIISGKLFDVKCPKCNHLIHLEYDLLYNDMKHCAMIWVIHKDSSTYTSKVSEARSIPALPLYKTLRIVEDMNSLKEKVSCLESNRDDRIIEFCKVFAMGQLLNEEPDFAFDKAFYTCNNGLERLILFDRNGDSRSCNFNEDIYDYLSDLYFQSSYPAKFNGNYPIVDSVWAEEIMMAILEPEAKRIDSKTEDSISKTELSKSKKEIFCPICNQKLPDDSQFCQYCGKNLNISSTEQIKTYETVDMSSINANVVSKTPYKSSEKKSSIKKFKPVLYISLVLILLCFVFCGYNCSCFTNALDNEEFTKAERHLNYIPFGESIYAAQVEYLNAGILLEKEDYIEAYRAFKQIEDYPVPDSTLSELENLLYIHGQASYKDGNYSKAKNYFEEIPNYKSSSDYLLLIDCSGDGFGSWSTKERHYSDLLKLLNNDFENADDIILQDTRLLERFLTARWEDGGENPYYFELHEDNGTTYNLPHKDKDGYYWLSDGMYMVGETESSSTKYFRFSIIDEDTISVYCYKDGSSYTLYRQ